MRPRKLLRSLARAIVFVAALVALVALAAPGVARADGTLRTVLVIDASSSMLSTDPKELRKTAAELFVDLARTGDEIAVTGFDGGVRESTGGFIAIRSPEDRAKLKAAIRAVGKNGSWTDFTQGLAEAKRLLDAAPKGTGDQSFVVFLTDGRCDPDPKGPLGEEARAAKTGSEAFCKQRVLDSHVPALGPARLFAIGLSRSAPREFLEEAARRTGGVGVATDKAEELPRLFADVYARLLGSTLVEGPAAQKIPIVVEEGALSLDVVLVGPRTLTARLLRPDGREVSTANARPDIEYHVDSPEYRLFKVAFPPVGTFELEVGGGGRGGRYAALQNLDLRLSFVDPPDVIEIGGQAAFRVRLATPGGRIPSAAFLDRHKVAVTASYEQRCPDVLPGAGKELNRGADSLYGFTLGAPAAGRLCLVAEMAPGAGGVLKRKTGMVSVRLVPPLRLAGAALDLGRVKQGTSGKASIDLSGSQIGEAIEAELALVGRTDLSLSPEVIALEPKGPRTFEVTLAAGRDASPGPAAGLTIAVRPNKPRGYEDRAVALPLRVEIVPLTFWERYGLWIKVGLGVFLFLFVLLGFAAPARFKRNLVLGYKDVRDPDLPREGTYPIGVKAKAGFYRGAKLLLAATGPVRAGALIELVPSPGGGVTGKPLGGRQIQELPREAPGGFGPAPMGEPRDVPLSQGTFRCAPGARYAVVGAGLVFWVEPRGR